MAEKEQSYDEQQNALKRDTERALLEAIKKASQNYDQPAYLHELSQAYAAVMQNRAPSERKGSGWSV